MLLRLDGGGEAVRPPPNGNHLCGFLALARASSARTAKTPLSKSIRQYRRSQLIRTDVLTEHSPCLFLFFFCFFKTRRGFGRTHFHGHRGMSSVSPGFRRLSAPAAAIPSVPYGKSSGAGTAGRDLSAPVTAAAPILKRMWPSVPGAAVLPMATEAREGRRRPPRWANESPNVVN